MNSRRIAVLLASAALAAGCATAKPAPTSSGFDDNAPSWASGEIPIGCGLGQATHHGNQSLTREAAVDKGRMEIGRSLNTQLQGMIKQYADQGETDGKDYSEEKVTSVSKSIVDQTLAGTRVKQTALVGKQFYALVCMDLEGFKGMVDNMNTLSSKMKAGLKARADAEFADLDKAIQESRAANAR